MSNRITLEMSVDDLRAAGLPVDGKPAPKVPRLLLIKANPWRDIIARAGVRQ